MNQPRLVVLDDEPDLAEFIQIVAERAGFAVEQFNDARLFKEQYNMPVDVIILDIMMPGMDGLEVIRFLSSIESAAVLILTSGFDSDVLLSAQNLAEEHGLNVGGSLGKPFRYEQLYQLLSELSITSQAST